MPTKWTHPIHARGIRSPQFLQGKKLTDKRILHYAQQGRYGPEIQARALADKPKKKQKSLLSRALRELLHLK